MLKRCVILQRRWMSSTSKVSSQSSNPISYLNKIPLAPSDPILGLTDDFKRDTHALKVSLGVGAYRDDSGKPYVLPSVLEAEKRMLASKVQNKEYAGIAGMEAFLSTSLDFAYGKASAVLTAQRVAAVQTISGTGACRLAGDFFAKFGTHKSIYLPNPTWGNHIPIMKNAGLEVLKYAYYNPTTRGLDFNAMMADIENAPDGSVFLLHACAHNPTGVDPTMTQWKEMSKVMKAKQHVPFFDCAYQGFASGDADKDAAAVRQFVDDGHHIFLSQSYAKNFGLYGERIGALSIVSKDKEEAERITSQLKVIIRPMYSNPPIHGALIVSTILSDPDLSRQWYAECKGMADRIISMRKLLRLHVEEASSSSSASWNHITDQIGMFCYTGLTKVQVEQMISQHHIYLTNDGRISMAGITSKNVEYVAKAIANVVSLQD